MMSMFLLHPGHVTDGGLGHTAVHALSSPYHVAILVAVAVLVFAWSLASRPVRDIQGEQLEEN
jgi:hypothetical protein